MHFLLYALFNVLLCISYYMHYLIFHNAFLFFFNLFVLFVCDLQAPEMPELRQFANLVQLNESREQLAMQKDDLNANVCDCFIFINYLL